MRRNGRPYESFLDSVISHASEERAEALLLPLLAHDAEHNGDLVHTLRVYFALNGNASRAAEALFLHRNGLLYRLGRIEELLRVPLSDSEIRLALELALRMIARKSPHGQLNE